MTEPLTRDERQVSDETAWEMCRHINTQRAECLKCPATKNFRGYGECQQACRGIAEDAYWTALSLTSQSHALPSGEQPVQACGQCGATAHHRTPCGFDFCPFTPSATPRSVYEAAKKALRRYVWKAQNPAAPIAGTASLDGAMVELRDALLAAGEEQGFENNSPDGGVQKNPSHGTRGGPEGEGP